MDPWLRAATARHGSSDSSSATHSSFPLRCAQESRLTPCAVDRRRARPSAAHSASPIAARDQREEREFFPELPGGRRFPTVFSFFPAVFFAARALTLCASLSKFIDSVTIARTVSERFFFVFSHATCSGVSHTLTRSVFRSAIHILRDHSQQLGDAPRLRDASARCVGRIAVE